MLRQHSWQKGTRRLSSAPRSFRQVAHAARLTCDLHSPTCKLCNSNCHLCTSNLQLAQCNLNKLAFLRWSSCHPSLASPFAAVAGNEDGECIGIGPPPPGTVAAVVVVTFNRCGPPPFPKLTPLFAKQSCFLGLGNTVLQRIMPTFGFKSLYSCLARIVRIITEQNTWSRCWQACWGCTAGIAATSERFATARMHTQLVHLQCTPAGIWLVAPCHRQPACDLQPNITCRL